MVTDKGQFGAAMGA